MPPEVSIVIPTRNRAGYLDVALGSLAAQDPEVAHEIVVVDDASEDDTAAVAERHGARVVRQSSQHGLNAGRNAGIRHTSAPLVAFLDDDIRVAPTWLRALRDGAARHTAADAFGGPIHARLEGPAPRSCGRERPPITSLELGPADREAPMVWGANFAVRRAALERLGGFDEAIGGHPAGEPWLHGDEEDWLRGLQAAGGRIVYLADAAVEHRRAGDDARLRALARAAYHRGRYARRSDERRGEAPARRHELRVLAGCVWHTGRRRCPRGVIMGAEALGRLVESRR
jgi:glycosyltransferase involved in cell wall biosynthesis